MNRPLFLLAPLACVAALAIFACEDSTPPIPCRDIPPGGCPASGADACSDPVCLNVFACVGGEWKFDHACGSKDAGADGAADARSGFAFDGGVDAPPGAFGGPGCPDLEMPDCPAGTAITCTSGCCGCADLFVCRDAGWDPWGSCSADAGVQPLTTP